jgi:hypothetical protein
LTDGSTWQTIHWLDLFSCYELGQATTASLTEEIVVRSYLAVAQRYGLPLLVKTDGDKLCYEATSGLPSLLSRVLAALGVHHLVIPTKQPWWNGVVERYIRTCRQEVQLPDHGDSEEMNAAMEAERRFYNEERCHSRCNDQPPATIYQPSPRQLPPDFDLAQVPITLQPTVVTRMVQASGRVSLAGHTYPFNRRYAGQTITVNYYLGIAWVGQTVTIQRQEDAWLVSLPDSSSKTMPCKHLLPQPLRQLAPERPKTPPSQRPEPAAFQTRRVTKTGQIAFYHRLYYVGIAHQGKAVYVAPTPEGLSVYNMDQA